MQITNSQLMDAFKQLEERVRRLEKQVEASDGSLGYMSKKLDGIESKISSFESNFIFWQRIGSFVSPIVAGIFVVLVQHFFFH